MISITGRAVLIATALSVLPGLAYAEDETVITFDAITRKFITDSKAKPIKHGNRVTVLICHPNTWRNSYNVKFTARDFYTTPVPAGLGTLFAINPRTESERSASGGIGTLNALGVDEPENHLEVIDKLLEASEVYFKSLKLVALSATTNSEIRKGSLEPTGDFIQVLVDNGQSLGDDRYYAKLKEIKTPILSIDNSSKEIIFLTVPYIFSKILKNSVSKVNKVIDEGLAEIKEEKDEKTDEIAAIDKEIEKAKADDAGLVTLEKRKIELMREVKRMEGLIVEVTGAKNQITTKSEQATQFADAALGVFKDMHDDEVTPTEKRFTTTSTDADELVAEVTITQLLKSRGSQIPEPGKPKKPGDAGGGDGGSLQTLDPPPTVVVNNYNAANPPAPEKKKDGGAGEAANAGVEKFTHTLPINGRGVVDFSLGIVGTRLRSDSTFYVGPANGPTAADPGPNVVLQGAKDEPGTFGAAAFAHFHQTGKPIALTLGASGGTTPNTFFLGGSLVRGRRSRAYVTFGVALGQSTVLDGDRLGAPPRSTSGPSTKARWRTTPFLAISFSLGLNKNTKTQTP